MRLILSTLLICLLALPAASSENGIDEFSIAGWNAWKKQYDQSLTARDGWLSLAGLYWLEPGKNTLGAAEGNSVLLPPGSPPYLATLSIEKDKLLLQGSYDLMFIDGERRDRGLLSVEKATRVYYPGYEFYLLKREKGYALRLIKLDSPKAKTFTGTDFIRFDEKWVKPARLIPHPSPQTMNVATVYGTTRVEKSAGWLEFEHQGESYRLEATSYGPDVQLYLFFSDETAGETTYAAGRYLRVDWPDKEGKTMLDFNRAYNPPCAYTEYATCPLTPPQNRLPIIINAGELDWPAKDT